jgi:cytochrome P450
MGLAPCIQLIHYREDIYPNPHQFQPERFLERQYTTGEFLPFGGGNRRCIGYALALLEFKLVLGTILQTYQPELVSNQILHPRRRGVTLSPAGGVPLKIYKRTAQPSQVLSLKVVEKSTN